MATYSIKTNSLWVCCVSVLALAGCESLVYTESVINETAIEVQQERVVNEYALPEFTPDLAQAVARHYHAHSDTAVDLTVYYDPKSKRNTALDANKAIVEIGTMLRQEGVNALNPMILPIKDLGETGRVGIAYVAYNATPPKDCEMMSGFSGARVDVDKEYKLGCTMDTLLVRQIARPKDLAGREDRNIYSEGRGASNIIDPVRAGVRNEPIEGYQASDD